MNEYLVFIEGIATRIKAAKEAADAAEAAIDSLITGDTIKARYECRKINEGRLIELEKKYSDATAEIERLQTCKKIAVEMYAKQTANQFIQAVKAGAKNLLEVPMHYKKFKAAAEAVLAGSEGLLHNHYYTVEISFPYYSKVGNYDITAFYTGSEGIITAADAEKASSYTLIPAADIEKWVNEAAADAAKVAEIKENAKKEISSISEKYCYIWGLAHKVNPQ